MIAIPPFANASAVLVIPVIAVYLAQGGDMGMQVLGMQVLYFRNPMTPLGTAGTTMAILGVLLYSLAKARDDRMNA